MIRLEDFLNRGEATLYRSKGKTLSKSGDNPIPESGLRVRSFRASEPGVKSGGSGPLRPISSGPVSAALDLIQAPMSFRRCPWTKNPILQ